MGADKEPSLVRIVLLMAVFVLIGVPLVAYLWETFSELLALRFQPIRLLIAIPVLALFSGLLYVLSRQISRMLGKA